MGQAEVVVAVVQGQLLVQALFALAQGGDASADRRHMLPDGEVEAFHECRVDLPATGCQHLLHGLKRPEDHPVTDAYQAPAPRRFDDLRIEQLGQGHPARLGHRACGLAALQAAPRSRNGSAARSCTP